MLDLSYNTLITRIRDAYILGFCFIHGFESNPTTQESRVHHDFQKLVLILRGEVEVFLKVNSAAKSYLFGASVNGTYRTPNSFFCVIFPSLSFSMRHTL